jgi:hypothetical protein
MTPGGFSHSETHGSKPTNGSPWISLFGSVLRRLSVPKHPPSTLHSLTVLFRSGPRGPGHLHAGEPASGQERPSKITGYLSNHHARGTEVPPARFVLALPLFGFQGSCTRSSWPFGIGRRYARGPESPVLVIPRKEVIQPQVLLRLPCYDLVPVTGITFGASLPCGLGRRLRVLPASMA